MPRVLFFERMPLPALSPFAPRKGVLRGARDDKLPNYALIDYVPVSQPSRTYNREVAIHGNSGFYEGSE
jgi:hypothetical protein